MVAKPAPNENANEEYPSNLRALDEEPGRIMSFFAAILFGSVWQGFRRPTLLGPGSSMAKTRFRVSALGEMLVTRPANGGTSSCKAMLNCCPRRTWLSA